MKASLFIIAGLLGLSLAVVACGDTEEEPGPEVTVTASGSTAPIATPSPSPSAAASTPAPAPSGWKVYSDTQTGVSFQYPADLELRDLTGPGASPSGVAERVLDFRKPGDPSRGVSLSISTNAENLSAKAWALQYTACVTSTIAERVVAGESAIMCTEQATEMPNAGAVVPHAGKIYHFGSLLSDSEFQQLLESLKL